MTTYVLLTDSDDGTALVACPDEAAAEKVAAAAVFTDGDVSAWLLPTLALSDWEKVATRLRKGDSTYDLHERANDGKLTYTPRES